MEREYRYMVFKLKDIRAALTREERAFLKHLAGKVHDYRLGEGKQTLECVVVESDWPEYGPTWAAIEERMDDEKNPDVTERPLDGLVGRAEALLAIIESDFGQSSRSVRIEAIVCELQAMKQPVLWEMVAEAAKNLKTPIYRKRKGRG